IDRDVVPDGLVDQILHPLEIPVLHRLGVREVEAEMVGRDQGAGLGHVGPEHLAERRVEGMRPRVMQPQPLAARRLDRDRGGAAPPRTAPSRPSRKPPPTPRSRCATTPAPRYCVSTTSPRPWRPVNTPVSPIWPPDSA